MERIYKMKRKSIKLISCLLAVVMTASFVATCLVGCNKNKGNKENNTPIEAVEVQATSVNYAKNGNYKTTISSSEVNLTGLTAENIEIRYDDPYKNLLTVSELSAAVGEGSDTASRELTLDEALPKKATITGVTANANGGYDIAFTDADAEVLVTPTYYVFYNNIYAYSVVEVAFPSITLTPDIESVFLGTEQFRVALTIDGAEFEDTLSEEDLYQDNAFAKVDMEIISKSSHNLTLEIRGQMTKSEADTYQWGTIGVLSTGIKNAHTDVEAKINIVLDYAGFDATSLKYADGKITADVKVYGVAEVDTLNKDNVTVEDVTVESLAKVDDNTIRLTLSAEDVASVNAFVDLVGGKKMTLGEYETTILLSQANFYPVFDYIEKAENNFDITLKLYIYGGMIDNALTAEKIALGGDFDDATVKSVAVDDHNLATVILTVPCGGFTEENYQFDGEVTLKAGSITNAWGEKTSAPYTYARMYCAETLGKEVTLNADTLSAIQDYTRGLDTTFGKVCYYAGIAGQVFGIVKNVAEMAGIVKSEHQQVMDKLDEMDQKLTIVQADVAEIKKNVNQLAYETKYYSREELRRDLQTKLDGFETTLITMNNALNVVKSIQQKAALDMAIEDAIAAGKLTEKPSFIGMTYEAIAAKKAELRALYLPNEDAMTNEEVAQYNVRLIQYINTKAADPNNVDYYGYTTYVMNLEEIFKTVCGLLEMPAGSNPIGFYDELVSQIYNFDSQTYNFRLANRVTLQYKLVNTIGVLAFHYQVAANPDSMRYQLIGTAFDKALKSNIWKVGGHPASEIKANPHYVRDSGLKTYIGEIMVSGSQTSAEEAKQYLIDAGYTVYDLDLNKGTKGCPIYLGYKTTNKFSEAISDFYLSQKHTATLTVDGLGTGYLAPYTGDDYFKALYGNLNRGCGSYSKGIYLYYFKNTAVTKTGVSAIHIYQNNSAAELSVPHDSGLNGKLNQGAGGYCEYLSVYSRQPEGDDPSKLNTLIETDTEYYPYSYLFGRKVSFYVSNKLAVDYDAELKTAGNVKTSWTENEIKEFLDRCQETGLLFGGELKAAGVRANQMYNGGETRVFYLSTSYVKKYYKSDNRNYIELDGMIMDDPYYRRYYVEDYGRQALAKKGSIYYFKFKDGWWWNQHTDYEHSAMYFILN